MPLNPNYLVKELNCPDPAIDKAWIKEISRREKEMKAGKVKILTHDEVFGKYKKTMILGWKLY